ncbi:hypothetical protein ABEF95_007851 [Exophiala dermatitidis]
MLCHDCRALIRQADDVFCSHKSQMTVKTEVNTTEFQAAIGDKCYLCTRLRLQLGDSKWQHVVSSLLKTNLVDFDKAASCHPPSMILVRLGCRLTPILNQGQEGKPLLGSSYSYGYIQVALLPGPPSLSPPHLPAIVVAAKGAPSTSDPRVLDLVHHWLETCKSSPSHSNCNHPLQLASYPSRLIDVRPDNTAADSWRLVEVDEAHGVTGAYLTLSHRWGSEAFKLERTTHADMLRGIPLSALPGTYQDAIRIARRLGVRYLWVDSICIFQDERLDLQAEAIRMAEIFGNALCNISALSGRQDGLFCTRAPELVNSDCVVLNAEDYDLKQSYFLNDLQLWRGELLHMPLTTRGWVLQEELLAARTIYFGSRQVLWACTDFRACETYPQMHPRRSIQATDDKRQFLHDEELGPIAAMLQIAKTSIQNLVSEPVFPDNRDLLFGVWTQFVAHYSLRKLTFPADKLLAIAGICKLFGGVMRDEFLAGLWRQHIMAGLLWYIRPHAITSHPVEYRAPSWSWASNEGYVMHAEPFNFSWTVARAVDVKCQTEDGKDFGLLVSARLRLQAPYLVMSIDTRGNWAAGRTVSASRFIPVPQLIVRIDSTEDLSAAGVGNCGFVGAIIRTTAYRLTDVVPGDGNGTTKKLLLAAQGIVLLPTGPIVSPTGNNEDAAVEGQSKTMTTAAAEYRRVGYFALEDRKSGSITPRWAPEGCRIFHEPVVDWKQRQYSPETGWFRAFPFEEQSQWLRLMDVI